MPAQITEFKLEGDSDIHLIPFDKDDYLIAEMPSPACIPKKARDRKAMIAIRKKFETSCGNSTKQWQPLGAVVSISGVVSSTFRTHRARIAPNFAELHPVTGLKIVSGC